MVAAPRSRVHQSTHHPLHLTSIDWMDQHTPQGRYGTIYPTTINLLVCTGMQLRNIDLISSTGNRQRCEFIFDVSDYWYPRGIKPTCGCGGICLWMAFNRPSLHTAYGSSCEPPMPHAPCPMHDSPARCLEPGSPTPCQYFVPSWRASHPASAPERPCVGSRPG